MVNHEDRAAGEQKAALPPPSRNRESVKEGCPGNGGDTSATPWRMSQGERRDIPAEEKCELGKDA